jgi:hypothetical protein
LGQRLVKGLWSRRFCGYGGLCCGLGRGILGLGLGLGNGRRDDGVLVFRVNGLEIVGEQVVVGPPAKLVVIHDTDERLSVTIEDSKLLMIIASAEEVAESTCVIRRIWRGVGGF